MPPVMKEGMFCHVEIPATDRPKTKSFFSDLFGWTFQSIPGMDGYEIYSTGAEGLGGGLWTPGPDMIKQVVNYILVASVDAHSARIAAAGGQIVKAKTEVPGMGWFAVFTDPEGNVWGIWESAMAQPVPERTVKKAAKKARKAKKAAKAAAKKAAKPARKAAKKAAKARPAAKKAKPAKKAKKAKKGRR